MATLNIAEARMITVAVDKALIPVIDKAIRAANDLGLNPVSDSELVRLPIPALTHERRKELVKVIKKMTEEARVAVRAARRDGNDMLKEAEADDEVSEDDKRTAEAHPGPHRQVHAALDQILESAKRALRFRYARPRERPRPMPAR